VVVGAISPAIVWTITTRAAPNLLVVALLNDSSGLAEQSFGRYMQQPPAPSRWVVPATG
jgi:hypothetical protein